VRREFITLLGGAAVAWPLGVRGQQSAMPVIGFLSSASPDTFGPLLAGFREGLRRPSFTIEFGWADGRLEPL
jgi:putative ABC transport system substrate-binding protein